MPEVILKTKELTKKYQSKTVVDSLDLEIRRGEIFGLLGPNVPRYEQETGSLFRHLQLWRELYT